MERTIRTLKEMLETHEKSFISASIIRNQSPLDSPVPDASADLEMIIELNKAISILVNTIMAKTT